VNLERIAEILTGRLAAPVSWTTALVLGVVVLAVGILFYRLAFTLLHRLSRRTGTSLDDLLIKRMRTPARGLIVLGAFHVVLLARADQLLSIRNGVAIIELLLIAYIVVEFAETLVLHYWFGERQGVEVPAVVRHLILVVFYVVAALSIIGSVTGINLLPILATSTVVTVVIGLALQDTLGNLLSGLAIHAEQPFSVGDWILVDGVEGQVVYMGWRSTRLRTFSADVLSIPNSVIARARVQNFYAPTKVCARNVEVLVGPSASPEAVERGVRRACESVPRVLDEPRPKVWLIGFTPLFHRYVVKIWVDDFQHHDDTESDLMKAVWRELRAEGVELSAAGAVAAVDPANPAGVIVAAAAGPTGGAAAGS
jgi:small-conductance mechanosensitive channel